jgi:hypothetical protein
MTEPLRRAEVHSTRRAFVRRAVISMFAAVPVVKALAFPKAGSAGGHPGVEYVDCVDQPCQWVKISEDPCCCLCIGGGFNCGARWGCFDPVTGTLCKCACGHVSCICGSIAPCQFA